MVDDPNRKTARQFQCRDYLWESFEQMSGELECSIDYLINEAMRHYLRAQGRTGPAPRTPTLNGEQRTNVSAMPNGNGPRMPTPAPSMRTPTMPPMPARVPAGPSVPPLNARSTGMQQPSMPTNMVPARAPAQVPSMPGMSRGGPGPGSGSIAPPMPRGNVAPQPQPRPAPQQAPPGYRASQQRTLYVLCDGQEVPVTKEEFVIGRGQKMCDLVIRDTNISRQHARVVLHNGQYWMIDNQSTNGVEFRGAKIQQKRVDDGDVYTICGHELQFAYR